MRYWPILLIGLGLLLMPNNAFQVRGLRNKNPGNLRFVEDNDWKGKVPFEDNTDGEFEQFDSVEYGIRALGKTLDTYYYTHGLNTIRQVISRFAPPSENDTESYIRNVRVKMNYPDSAPFNSWEGQQKLAIVKAIIHHENGVQPFSDQFILDSLRLT